MAHAYCTIAPDTGEATDIITADCFRYPSSGRYSVSFQGPDDGLPEATVIVNTLDNLAAIGKEIVDYCQSQVVTE